MLEFKESTYGLPCATCRLYRYSPRNMQAHHVVSKQELKKRGRTPLLWDRRNALPLCADCHERHENASRRVSLSALTPENVEFAREVLGDYADYYLERYYATEPCSTTSVNPRHEGPHR